MLSKSTHTTLIRPSNGLILVTLWTIAFFGTLLLLQRIPAPSVQSFSVLSYNVAGLPSLFNWGSKRSNAAAIGTGLATFDIVQVQEDWAYHSELYTADTHRFRTEHSGNVPFGSGLNTMSNFVWTNFTRTV
jgi:hypothetical protein